MTIKENFVLRQVAGSYVAVAVGEASVNFDGMLTLNESGALLFLFEYTTSIPSEAQLGDGSYQLMLSLGGLARGSQGTETEPLCAGPWAFTIPLTVESLSPVRTLAEAVAVVPVDDSSAGSTGESPAPSPSVPADRPDSALEGV